jgi:hypothetical protein
MKFTVFCVLLLTMLNNFAFNVIATEDLDTHDQAAASQGILKRFTFPENWAQHDGAIRAYFADVPLMQNPIVIEAFEKIFSADLDHPSAVHIEDLYTSIVRASSEAEAIQKIEEFSRSLESKSPGLTKEGTLVRGRVVKKFSVHSGESSSDDLGGYE